MSSVLEVGTPDSIISIENDSSGLDIIGSQTESNTIIIGEKPGEESLNNPGADNVIGGSAFDFIKTGDGDDIIMGGGGDDLLYGEAGSDLIRGGEGNDDIIGGEGADDLIGGSGADTFKFALQDFASGEIDTIRDFEVGLDKIIINGIDPDLATVEGNMVKYEGETIINLSGDVTGIQGQATDEDTFELF